MGAAGGLELTPAVSGWFAVEVVGVLTLGELVSAGC